MQTQLKEFVQKTVVDYTAFMCDPKVMYYDINHQVLRYHL